MPAVSGVWSCLHYPVPRGGFSPPGLGCFLACAGLTVNPKSTREITAVISPPRLSPPTMSSPPLLKWILSGGGSQDTLNTFLQSLFPFHFLLLPLPLFSSISGHQRGLSTNVTQWGAPLATLLLSRSCLAFPVPGRQCLCISCAEAAGQVLASSSLPLSEGKPHEFDLPPS